MKITFTMTPHASRPKHSTRFSFERLEGDAVHSTLPVESLHDLHKFRPEFYIPKPVAEGAKRIRVTIEEIA